MVWSPLLGFPQSKNHRLISVALRIIKFLGKLRIEPGGCWLRSTNATSVLCHPSRLDLCSSEEKLGIFHLKFFLKCQMFSKSSSQVPLQKSFPLSTFNQWSEEPFGDLKMKWQPKNTQRGRLHSGVETLEVFCGKQRWRALFLRVVKNAQAPNYLVWG